MSRKPRGPYRTDGWDGMGWGGATGYSYDRAPVALVLVTALVALAMLRLLKHRGSSPSLPPYEGVDFY